jgi:hypothetical protein
MSALRLVPILLTAVAAFAQPPDFFLFPQGLRDYLALSSTQADAVARLNLTYDRLSAEKLARIAQVRADVALQTAADPIDPMALGVRYAEIEAINRDLRDKLAGLRTDVAKVLLPAQQVKLKTLADAQALAPLITKAECEYLLVRPLTVGPLPADLSVGTAPQFVSSLTACASFSNILPSPGRPAPALPLDPELVAYLSLTNSQADLIWAPRHTYQLFSAEKTQRIYQVQADIGQLTAADPLDPGALGLRYAEIEAINRDLRDKRNGLRDDIAKLLTPVQQGKLIALETARSQAPLISAAVCENLLAPSAPSDLLLGIPASRVAPYPPARYCGN